MKIVIVGAGLAGLTSAYRLHQLGYDVELYEARCRPGGRVCTAYFDGSYEEFGGKNIRDGGDALSIRALIKEMGLSTQTTSLDILSGFFYFNDQIFSIKDLISSGPKPTESLYQALFEKTLKTNTLAELIAPLFQKNPALNALIRQNMRGYMGTCPSKISSKYLDIGFWEFYKMKHDAACDPKTNRYFIMEDIIGGNSLLIDALVKKLKGHVHYSKPLRKVSFDHKLRLQFGADTFVSADYLILAIPASTLKDVDIANGLIPQDQLFAIHTQQYATNAKILLPFKQNMMNANIYSCFEQLGIWLNKSSDVMTWYYGGSYGDFAHDSVLETFTNGLAQLHKILPVVTSHHHQSIAIMKDKFMAHYHGPVAVSWVQEEFSKGSYSNLSPEQFDVFNLTTQLGGERVRYVYRPVNGKIFFSGEHASIHAPSTLEGAVESGEQAARLLHAVSRFR